MREINTKQLDLNLIKTFSALMDTRSVTKAADELNIGQPAMSHALARLRSALDDEVFVRTASGMRPTRRAREMEVPIRRAMLEIEKAFVGAREFDPSVEYAEFTVAMTDYSECVLLAPLLLDLAKSAPNISVRVVPYAFYNYRRLLNENDVDLVIGRNRTSLSGFEQEPLFNDIRRCVFAKEFGPPTIPVSLKDYISMRHVLIARDAENSSPIDHALAQVGKRRDIALTTSRFSTLPAVLKRAPLIATLPGRLHYMFSKDDGFVSSDLPFDSAEIRQGMIWHGASNRNPAFRWFLGRMRAAANADIHGSSSL